MTGRIEPILIAVCATAVELKVLEICGIWARTSSVVMAPDALMVPVSTVTRFEPTGLMPLIIVPVTVTDSTGAVASCACAAPAIAIAIAPKDAPHNSFVADRPM